MTTILPPNRFESGEPVAPSPGKAAAPFRQTSGAAADIPEPTTDGGGPQESPAVEDRNPDAAGDLGIDCIGEIFAGAAKLDELDDPYLFELDPGNQKYRGMHKPRLNVAAFMNELDEPPLFIKQQLRA